jgi:hypothetical protein
VATSGDRVVSPVTGARKALTSGTRLPKREIVRERGECGLTGGAGLAAAKGRGARARGRWAAWAAEGGGEFFLFFFSIFYFLFLFLISFSFEQIIS